MDRKRIGDYFIEKGILSEKDKNHVLKVAHQTGKSFGEAALDLGVISREDMVRVFGPSFEIDFFYLDSKYFPLVTKSVLDLEHILKYGTIPLGLKKKEGFLSKGKFLNLGFLNPSNKDNVKEVESIVRQKMTDHFISDIKIYLILADQFIHIVKDIYGLDLYSAQPHHEMDEVLKLFLER